MQPPASPGTPPGWQEQILAHSLRKNEPPTPGPQTAGLQTVGKHISVVLGPPVVGLRCGRPGALTHLRPVVCAKRSGGKFPANPTLKF